MTTMMEEKIDDDDLNNNMTLSAEEQLQRLLQEAGLESVPMDPASMAALKDLVSQPDFHEPTPMTASSSSSSSSSSRSDHRPVSDVAHPWPRVTSEQTTTTGTTPTHDDTTSGGGRFVPLEDASPVENRILEQLHRQTGLLREMQRQIDHLTTTVEDLSSTTTTAGCDTAPGTSRTAASAGGRKEGEKGRIVTTPTTPPHPPPPPAPAAPRILRARRRVVVRNHDRGRFLDAVRTSRLYQIAAAFGALRRRYGVLPLDGGLILKIVVMMAILSTRMMSRSSSKRSSSTATARSNANGGILDETQVKILGLTVLILMGFLLQTGYVKYSYIFFVKENIAGRIWNGETVDDILRANNNNDNNNNDPLPRGPVPPGPPPRGNGPGRPNHNNNNGEQNAAGGWRNTFLGGIIPQADQGGIVGVFQDIALVLGSFLLSIFPMWQPEGPPPAPPPPPEETPPPPAGGLAAGPGEVRPPRDVLQAADDDSDEENNNENDEA